MRKLLSACVVLCSVLECTPSASSREGSSERIAKEVSTQTLLWSFVARSLVHCHLEWVGDESCNGLSFSKISSTKQGFCRGWDGSAASGASETGTTVVDYVVIRRGLDLQANVTASTETVSEAEITHLYQKCEISENCDFPGSWICHLSQCLCTPGHYYCSEQNTCVANCSSVNLRSEDFVEYPELYISDASMERTAVLGDETACQRNCSLAQLCRGFNYRYLESAGPCELFTEDGLLRASNTSFQRTSYEKYKQKLCC